jgi:aryl-alcohol dehydrogenase-like predicted oxidoreductase
MAANSTMSYRRLGASGLEVSVVGLGCNYFGSRIDEATSRTLVDAAFDTGINFFDTANIYGGGESERCLGSALGARRDEAIVATKWGRSMASGPNQNGASRRLLVRQVEESLRRLGTDYIDLFQLHFPDPATPIEETLRALDDVVASGKVRYVGASNFAAWQLVDAAWTSRSNGLTTFVSTQAKYSLLDREVELELVPACERLGVALLPWLALAGGLLSGKYQRTGDGPPGGRLSSDPGPGHPQARLDETARLRTQQNFDLVEALTEYAAHRGLTLLDVALGGLAARPGVASVLAGASSPAQVQANARAGTWSPTPDDRVALETLLTGVAQKKGTT